MGNVVFDISVSLDGYLAGAGRTAAEPLGEGGDRLHDWLADGQGQELLAKAGAGLGAVICGRRTYDDSLPWWGADGPTGSSRVPVVVVTGRPVRPHGVYRFAAGVDDALAQARSLAGERGVTVMGGASIGGQFIAAGLVDEIQLHLVPIVLGGGVRFYDGIGRPELTRTELIDTPAAMHLRYRIGS